MKLTILMDVKLIGGKCNQRDYGCFLCWIFETGLENGTVSVFFIYDCYARIVDCHFGLNNIFYNLLVL